MVEPISKIVYAADSAGLIEPTGAPDAPEHPAPPPPDPDDEPDEDDPDDEEEPLVEPLVAATPWRGLGEAPASDCAPHCPPWLLDRHGCPIRYLPTPAGHPLAGTIMRRTNPHYPCPHQAAALARQNRDAARDLAGLILIWAGPMLFVLVGIGRSILRNPPPDAVTAGNVCAVAFLVAAPAAVAVAAWRGAQLDREDKRTRWRPRRDNGGHR